MNKKTLSFALFPLLLFAAYVPAISAHNGPHPGDANGDGKVDEGDVGFISAHWTAAGLPYVASCDMNGQNYLTPDGIIDLLDVAVVSAFWDSPPQGPAHP